MLKSWKFPPSVKPCVHLLHCPKSHLWFSLETSKIGMVFRWFKPLGSLPIIHDFSCCRKYCNFRDGNSDSLAAKNTFWHAYHNYNSTNDFIIAE